MRPKPWINASYALFIIAIAQFIVVEMAYPLTLVPQTATQAIVEFGIGFFVLVAVTMNVIGKSLKEKTDA